jgi:hypothetical protein
MLLNAEEPKVAVAPIHHHPDEAGLIGALHLMPSWMIEAHDGIIAVDIGGTNIRVGVATTNLKKAPDLGKTEVWKSELWRHADDEPKRDEAVNRMIVSGRSTPPGQGVRRAWRRRPRASARRCGMRATG